jgi:hypothetical protein
MCTPSKLGDGIELKGPGRYKKVMISQDVSIFFIQVQDGYLPKIPDSSKAQK